MEENWIESKLSGRTPTNYKASPKIDRRLKEYFELKPDKGFITNIEKTATQVVNI